MAETYRALDGSTFDIDTLDEHQRGHFERCLAAYREGVPFRDFVEVAHEPGDLVTEEARGRPSQDSWGRPLLRMLLDLERRLAIRQGEEHPNRNEDPDVEPFL